MAPILLFPDPPPPELIQSLDMAGYAWKAVANAVAAEEFEIHDGWGGAILVADQDPDAAFSLARALKKRSEPIQNILILINGGQLNQLELRDDLYDDFCLTPFHPQELQARLNHLFWKGGQSN